MTRGASMGPQLPVNVPTDQRQVNGHIDPGQHGIGDVYQTQRGKRAYRNAGSEPPFYPSDDRMMRYDEDM